MTTFKPMEIKSSTRTDNGAHSRLINLLWQYRHYLGLLMLPVFLYTTSFIGNDDGQKKGNAVCKQECSNRREQRYQHFRGRDLLDRKDLLQLVTYEKNLFIERLKNDYGEENFANIFLNRDGTPRPFVPFGDASPPKLKRKLMIKVLSAQSKVEQEESTFNGCDCINGDIGIHRELSEEEEDNDPDFPPLDPLFEKYVWATGGHSASAAHGNLYNESYTAFLERDMKDVFGSIGIDFQGRNYAMGGTGSAAEVSMCWTEIFGQDVDFFSWDYGMTDAGEPHRLIHYAYRGAISPGRPAFMGIRVNLDRGKQDKLVEKLENYGIPIFIQDNRMFKKMRKGVPDTFGLTTNEINAMPEYVRNFKCEGVFEKGEPFCDDERYTGGLCENRRGKAPWHPGMKTHAMVGHALSLFLVENLQAALEELVKHDSESAETLLAQLRREEEELFQNHVLKAIFRKQAKNTFFARNGESIDLDASIFFTGKSMCHTARTPAQSRYLGYLTNTDKVGGPAPVGKETYDVGILDKEAPLDSGEMLLTWEETDMRQDDCPVAVSIDYKDSFLSQGSGWNTLTVPNEAERKAYGYNPSDLQGLVVISFRSCDWDKCEKEYLGPKDFYGEEKKWEMKVNGVVVENLVDIGHKVFLLQSKTGIYFPPTSDNDYKFEIKVNEPSKYVKISTFIVY
mmetsp:Transcript_24217/g.67078  ORF Transcript_24217/g.67078 Transcript_24217/m.67078 type:complete len:678 (+) Transcript_24217:253-2286(+)